LTGTEMMTMTVWHGHGLQSTKSLSDLEWLKFTQNKSFLIDSVQK